MVAYATRRDVYTYGLPRGALGNPGRLVASSLAATSTIELIEHGFETDDPVTLRATGGGTLSAPLVEGTIYYVISITDSTFQLAIAPATGIPITLTTDGVSMMVTMDLPFDQVLEYYSRFVDGFVPHAVPLPTPYPITVIAIVAELAAKKLQILSGLTSGSMNETEMAAQAQLKRWASGVPARDASVQAKPSNLAVVKSTTNGIIGFPLRRGCFPDDNCQ